MDLLKVLETMDEARGECEAGKLLGYWATQAGFLAGRTLAPAHPDLPWRTQCFHDAGEAPFGSHELGTVVLATQGLLDSCQIVLAAGHAAHNPIAVRAEA